MVLHPRAYQPIHWLYSFRRHFILSLAAFLAGFVIAPDAGASHICSQEGIECRGPDVGPWSFRVSIPFPSLFPIVYESFSTEEQAIAAGQAAACLPEGDTSPGAMVCSCTTTIPTVVPLSWSFGVERYRGPGTHATASYLVDDVGTCATSRPWSFQWSVSGQRTVECPAGYYPDDHNPPEICWRQDPCPISAPRPYEPDPYPSDDVANLSPRMQTASQCFQTAVRNAGGTFAFKSAYRPTAYNQHLREVWNKWMNEFRRNSNVACQARRTEVENHFNTHELQESPTAQPHLNSAHTRLDANGNPAGEAIDIRSNLSYGVLDVLAYGCNLYGPDPIGDTPHFIHR